MSPQTSTVFTSIEQLEKIKKHFLMLEAIVFLLCCKIQLSVTRQIIYAVKNNHQYHSKTQVSQSCLIGYAVNRLHHFPSDTQIIYSSDRDMSIF